MPQKKFILVVSERDISIFQAKSTGLLEDYCAGKEEKSFKEYNLSLHLMLSIYGTVATQVTLKSPFRQTWS